RFVAIQDQLVEAEDGFFLGAADGDVADLRECAQALPQALREGFGFLLQFLLVEFQGGHRDLLDFARAAARTGLRDALAACLALVVFCAGCVPARGAAGFCEVSAASCSRNSRSCSRCSRSWRCTVLSSERVGRSNCFRPCSRTFCWRLRTRMAALPS